VLRSKSRNCSSQIRWDLASRMCWKKKQIYDEDLRIIAADETSAVYQTFELLHVQVSCGKNSFLPRRSAFVIRRGANWSTPATARGGGCRLSGDQNRIVNMENELIEFNIQAVTEGIDALADVTIRIRRGNRHLYGAWSAYRHHRGERTRLYARAEQVAGPRDPDLRRAADGGRGNEARRGDEADAGEHFAVAYRPAAGRLPASHPTRQAAESFLASPAAPP